MWLQLNDIVHIFNCLNFLTSEICDGGLYFNITTRKLQDKDNIEK